MFARHWKRWSFIGTLKPACLLEYLHFQIASKYYTNALSIDYKLIWSSVTYQGSKGDFNSRLILQILFHSDCSNRRKTKAKLICFAECSCYTAVEITGMRNVRKRLVPYLAFPGRITVARDATDKNIKLHKFCAYPKREKRV